ncbi:MAG TPA: NADPH-dependent FMN reductase [Myxococcales bacterium]|nr:NADPH-dependent FMN reductase [Myxococcales bacterium]
MRILAISGSLRAHSSNTALLQAVSRIAPAGMDLVLFQGLRELPHFDPDLDAEGLMPPPAVARLREQVSAADGLIICSPEYAHGVPGALKNALDWLVSDPDFVGKPVLLWNASAAGGEYAQSSLLETLRTMSARVLEEACLQEPFLKKKLVPGGQLPEEAARAVRSSLLALAGAASGAKARAGQ